MDSLASHVTATGAPSRPPVASGAARSLMPRRVIPPLWREARAGGLLLTMLREQFREAQPRPGAGAPVLLVPGLFAGDVSLTHLASILGDHGLAVWPSGIRSNVGCSGMIVQRLVSRLEAIADEHRSRVALVGHSRGGLLARAVAQRRPALVSGVVTLGSPHRDQLAVHPLLWANIMTLATLGSLGVPGLMRFGCRGTEHCCRGYDDDVAASLPAGVGSLSVFSRRDGVADWRACLDPGGSNVEVDTTHCGMPGDPAAQRAVLEALERFESAPHVEPAGLAMAA